MAERSDPKDQNCLRVSPILAQEIGLNESLVLMQLDYLNTISKEEHDGLIWCYNTLEELIEKYFPYMSKSTLSRVINGLKESGYIKTGKYNKYGYDRTQWFHVVLEKCLKLRGFIKFQNGKSDISKWEIDEVKMGNEKSQIETTIQETQEEIQEETQKENSSTGVEEAQDAPPVAAEDVKPPKGKGKASKPPDERTKHPAIQAYLAVAKRYPSLELYDLVILRLGDKPDVPKLTECRVVWIERGFNPTAAVWATEWYVTGIPPSKNQVRGSPKLKGDDLLVSNLMESENWLKKYEVTNERPRPS